MSNGGLGAKFWVPILVAAVLTVASLIYGGVALGVETRLDPRVTVNERSIGDLKQVDAYREAQMENVQEDLREVKSDVKEILREIRK